MNVEQITNTNDPPIPKRLTGRRLLAGIMGGTVAAFIGYSFFVAYHEPEPQETILLGQSRLAAGSPASWRILVRNRTTGRPVAKAKILLKLRSGGDVTPLGTFITGKEGTLAESVMVPALTPGDYTLAIEVRSRLGHDQIERKVTVANPAQIFLTTDKPLYQPGQTIHLRALVCNNRTHQPLASQSVTFEVNDAKGNKVFKEAAATSRFGIVSADFPLASELNQGRFEIHASAGLAVVERGVEVKNYVLPKFKTAILFEKSFYHPGELMKGSVQVSYFFGKPASAASVELTTKAGAGQTAHVEQAAGTTDASGKFSFELALPYQLADLLQRESHPLIELTAKVSDTGGHVETTILTLPLSKNEMELAVFPEGGNIVPGVTNLFYVAASYPDGRPAVCRVTVNGRLLQTDAEGVCITDAVPSETGFGLDVKAWDLEGRTAELFFKPNEVRFAPPLLLRPRQAVLQAGQNLELTVLSRQSAETVFIDVIRDGQTVATHSVAINGNHGELAFPLPSGLSGMLRINAYLINQEGKHHGCSRFVFVNPAGGLQIQTRTDKPVYRPGETAKVELQVRNAKGEVAPAALGICAVDESLFSLHANSSGLVQSMCDGENELLNSQHRIKAFESVAGLSGNASLAQAWLSSLQPAVEQPRLEELVAKEYLPQRSLERARRWKGTPYYDRMKKDPAYAQIFQLLEYEDHDYDLSEATGPAKKWAVEQHRARYFRQLKDGFVALFVLLFFASPFVLMMLTFKGSESRLIEILVIFGFMAMLAGLLLPALAKAKAKAASINAQSDLRQMDLALKMAEADGLQTKQATDPGGAAPARVRTYFPETLFWRPEVITDDHGKAVVEIPLADSITIWRTSLEAINAGGKIGIAELPIRVFQDFFIDLDLPVSLSLHDEVSLPVTCYNYLASTQEIVLTLEQGNWFKTADSARHQTVRLAPNEVKALHLPLKVTRVGQHRLRVFAASAKTADAISREIEVRPSGQRLENLENSILRAQSQYSYESPPGAIPAASSLWVRFFPSRFSEVVEGLDSIFETPHGCFEQTSSTTYPNALALDYLKTMGLLKPDIAAKARRYINEGYQRLLSFEVAGGGFEWFGHSPANICLTAYGVLEFSDMARVHPVDPKVISRTAQWLNAQQNSDGSWSSGQALHAWSQNPAVVTAYVAWALAEAGERTSNLERALEYLRSHRPELASPYALALAANAFLASNPSDPTGKEMAATLLRNAQRGEAAKTCWISTGQSVTWSHGESLQVETTALCATALMKAGLGPQTVKEALQWLSAQKAPNGTWHTTQATILAMRALLRGSGAALGQDFASEVSIWLNGRRMEVMQITPQNSDLMRLVNLTPHLLPGKNNLELRQQPAGELPCQISFVHWLPESSPPAISKVRPVVPLQIDLRYTPASLAVSETLHCRGVVQNNSAQSLNMVMVELGIPPGFAVDGSAFQEMQEQGRIAKFESTQGRVALYLRELPADGPFAFEYR